MSEELRQIYKPRKVLVSLGDDDFHVLAELAIRNTRTPDQQVTHMVLRSLRALARRKGKSE